MHVQDYKQYLKDLSLNYHFYYSLYIYMYKKNSHISFFNKKFAIIIYIER